MKSYSKIFSRILKALKSECWWPISCPFKIVIEYRGVPEVKEDDDGISTGLKYANKLCDTFVVWARRFHHHNVQVHEKEQIRNNRIELLSETTRQYFEEFIRIFLKYSLPKDLNLLKISNHDNAIHIE